MLTREKIERFIIGLLIVGLAFLGWWITRPRELVLNTAAGKESDTVNQIRPSTSDSLADRSDSEDSYQEVSVSASDQKISMIYVHIEGCVKNPGFYEIKMGSRVQDLIDLAGGLAEAADLRPINLAQRLEDEMKVRIPSKEEMEALQEQESHIQENYIEKSASSSAAGMDSDRETGEKVNINSASKEELMSLPSIGEKKAEAILTYREDKRFERLEELMEVSGIGPKLFEALKDLIKID